MSNPGFLGSNTMMNGESIEGKKSQVHVHVHDDASSQLLSFPKDQEHGQPEDNESECSSTGHDGGDDEEAEAAKRLRAEQKEERRALASKENKVVHWLRAAAFLILTAAAVTFSVLVFQVTRNDQQEEFLSEYESYSAKVLEAFTKSVERQIVAIDALSSHYTSYVLHNSNNNNNNLDLNNNETNTVDWPRATLPDFEVIASSTRILADAVVLHYHPLVTDDTRALWEEYAKTAIHSYDDTYEKELEQQYQQDIKLGYIDPTNEDKANATPLIERPIPNVIFNSGNQGPAEPGTGPYLPIWQMAPATPVKAMLNTNVLTHPIVGPPYRETIETGQATFSATTPTGDWFHQILKLSQYRNSMDEYDDDPLTTIGYPVFDSFDPTTREVTGVIAASLYWRLYFQNILPVQAQGILCVFANRSFNQTFSYRIDGAKATYLGEGDHHDPNYDWLQKSASMADTLRNIRSTETQAYTAADVNTKFGNYDLFLYPTQETEEQFVNAKPVYYTIAIVCVFVFSSIVFVAYDCIVARRQRIVMERALASGAIVSSLFPKQVREQLYEERKEEAAKPEQAKNTFSNALASLQQQQQDADDSHTNNNTLSGGGKDSMNGSERRTESRRRTSVSLSRPIADHFEQTSIFFGDLAGFTAWSAKRTPQDVFGLLEHVYGAMDKICKRRGVFKVETIGDCYVAVTGIPEPQKNHAVILCRFAMDAMVKMNQITDHLAETMGEDTKDLKLRVGIHSGSTTAGVLRGDKGRFQLFGDSVNTASRMETNGIPGRIHVSEDTANALKARGKACWLTPREDKIVAKGKGEMNTYFVTIVDGSIASRNTANSGHLMPTVSTESCEMTDEFSDEDDDVPVLSATVEGTTSKQVERDSFVDC